MNGIDEKKGGNLKAIAAGLLALAAAGIFFFSFLMNEQLKIFVTSHISFNYNLLLYMLTVLIFAASDLLAIQVLPDLYLPCRRSKPEILLLALILCNSLLLFDAMRKELLQFSNGASGLLWFQIPSAVLAVLLLVLFYISVRQYQISLNNDGGRKKLLPTVLSVLAVFYGLCFYYPNYFVSDMYHGDAYFNSVYNALHNVPYTESVNSIYGYYGIFYALPLRLLGGTYKRFTFLVAVLSFLAIACVFFVLYKTVKSYWLVLLGALALISRPLATMGANYWQTYPHRILFPCLFIGLSYMWIHSGYKKGWEWAGYFFSIFSILWNVETGIVGAAAWAVMLILRKWMQRPFHSREVLLTVLKELLFLPAAFLCAYGLAEGYNLISSGHSYGLRTFLYPYLSGGYDVNGLMVDLPAFNSAYWYVMLLYGIVIAYCMSKITLYRQQGQLNPKVLLLSFLAVSGLGQMCYYMNRAAYSNLTICHIQAILILCLFVDLLWENKNIWILRGWQGSIRQAMAIMFMAVIGITAFGNIQTPVSFSERLANGIWDMREYNECCETVQKMVPENTPAVGRGVTEIYSTLGWDTGIHTLDFPDMNEAALKEINAAVRQNKRIFTTQETAEELKLDGYQIILQIDAPIVYQLYERVEE